MQSRPQGSPKSAIVIGAGVVGLSCAIGLQQRGFGVTLIDPDLPGHAASWGNAGHIAVEQVAPLASMAILRGLPRRLFSLGGAVGLPLGQASAWLPFALRLALASGQSSFEAGKGALSALLRDAVPAWQRLLHAVDAPDLLREDGHLVVWETAGGAARGRAEWARADTGTARFREASADDMVMLAGVMTRPPAGAIRFSGSAQIADLAALAAALKKGFVKMGGTGLTALVDRISTDGPSAGIRTRGGDDLDADLVVVAAGVASAELLVPLGFRVPLIAERGYHVEIDSRGWPDALPPVVFEERSMIVTRFRSRLRAAGFVEFSQRDAPPDTRKWQRLEAHLEDLGLPVHTPATRWMGSRPTLPDYLPAIGRSARQPAILYAFGHQHLGLTLAAVTGEAIAALSSGDSPAVNPDPFSIRRFG